MLKLIATILTVNNAVSKTGKNFRSYKAITDNGKIFTLLDFNAENPVLKLNEKITVIVSVSETVPLFVQKQ